METIKNLLHPGKTKDDEQLYSGGQSKETTTTGTGHTSGEGSHFSDAKDTTASNPITGTHTSGNTSNPTNASNLSGTKETGYATHEPFSGEGKHLESSTNTGATSGFTSQQTSGFTGSHPTTTGQSHLGRDATLGAGAGGLLGHEAQKHQTTSGLGSSTGTSGVGNTQTSGLTSGSSNPYSSTSTTDHNNSSLVGTSALPSSTTGTTAATSHVPGEWVEDNSNVGNTQHPSSNTNSGQHLGRDAAALGTAGGIGAGIHEHNQNQRELPIRGNDNTTSSSIAHPNTSQLESNQGYPSTTIGTSGLGTTQGSSSGHHLGRDAAIGGAALGGAALGGAGLAAHEHNNTEREFPLVSSTGASTTSTGHSALGLGQGTSHQTSAPTTSTGYSGPGVASGTSHHTGPTGSALQSSGPHSTDTANLLDPSVNRSAIPTEDAHHHSQVSGGGAEEADKHHGAHNAGLGASALAAVGLGKHEHDKHQQTSATGAASASTNPTSSHTGVGYSTTNSTSSSTTQPTSSTHHHTGRDAGVGAGALGAAGLAKHEHDKHQTSSSTGATSGLGQSTSTNPTSSHTGDSHSTTNPTSSTRHHHGKEAEVGAGALGAAGLAEHEHKKHETTSSTRNSSGTTPAQTASTTTALPGPAPNTAGPHRHDILNKLDPRVKSNPDPSTASKEDKSHDKDHHYGRDAIAAGGVGGAAYEADKHHKSHEAEKSQVSPPGATTHPIPEVGTRAHSTGDPLKDYHYGNKPGLVEGATGTHPTEASKDHHYGRDAGVAGGAGAVGAGAYEANKHHDAKELEKEAKKEHKHEEKEAKKESKHEHKEEHHEKKSGGLLSFLHRDKTKKYTKEEEDEFDRQEKDHHSRNAALGAGAVGAGGIGAYEANKHRKSHEAEKSTISPLGTTTHPTPGVGAGAGTHGALSESSTSATGQHHTGRDAALSAGAVAAVGAGAHEHNKHVTPLAEKPVGTDLGDKLHGVERNRGVQGSSGLPGSEGYGSGTSGAYSEATTDQSGHPIGTGSSTAGASHLGRDAAISGAGLGGAGVAAHEHRKHDSGYAPTTTEQAKTTSTTPSTTGIYEGNTSSTVASSGLAHEDKYRKQDTTSGLTGTGRSGEYDPYSTAQQPSVLDSGLGNKVSDASGRNRLHKDPPAGHPAAQSRGAHVPASGSERETLVKQGEEKLGTNTGVHNAAETNY